MKLKRGLLAGVVLCCMPLMTACSAKDTIGILVGSNSEETQKEEKTADAVPAERFRLQRSRFAPKRSGVRTGRYYPFAPRESKSENAL